MSVTRSGDRRGSRLRTLQLPNSSRHRVQALADWVVIKYDTVLGTSAGVRCWTFLWQVHYEPAEPPSMSSGQMARTSLVGATSAPERGLADLG